MIQQLNKKTIEVSGEVVAQADYHIDPTATAHLMAILRNLYADPHKAVVREYVSNAIDAHVEAGRLDTEIIIHLPTTIEPWFSVRDFGNGLDLEQTQKLLYGYGASGEHKRNSNDQIGGFGIGCKCAFAISDSFIYTIWNGGTKRVWSCFLDDHDAGKSNLVSEEDSDEPTGVEVQVAVKMQYGTENQIQRCLNEVMTFLPGKFKFTGSTIYKAPTKPTPLVEQSATCTVNGVSTKLEFQFFPQGTIPDMPVLVVGGAIYKIAADHLEEALALPDADTKRLRTLTKLLEHTAVICPIGFLQLAPSREELQYSGLTKKVLRGIFQMMYSDKFSELVKAKAEKSLEGSNTIDKIRKRKMLSLRIDDDTTETGLVLKPAMADGGGSIQINQLIYSGSAYINGLSSMFLSPGNGWKKQTATYELEMISAYRINDLRDSIKLCCVGVTSAKSDEEIRIIGQRAATKIKQDEGALNQVYSVQVLILHNPVVDKIPWLKDGSLELIQEDDLPEVDMQYFQKTKSQRQAAYRKTYVRPKGTSLGTKFLKLRDSSRSDSNGDGAYWDPIPIADVTGGVYAVLDKFCVCKPGEFDYSANSYTDNSQPYSLVKWIASQSASLSLVLPAIATADKILGVKKANVTPALKQSKDYTLLWDYIQNRFREDVASGKLDVDALLASLIMEDVVNGRISSGDDDKVYKAFSALLATPHINTTTAVKNLKPWAKLWETAHKASVTQAWLSIIRSFNFCNVSCSYGAASKARLLTIHRDTQLFDMSKGKGALTTWWNSQPKLTSRKKLDETSWLRIEALIGATATATGVVYSPSAFEKLFIDLVEQLPVYVQYYGLRNLWDAYGFIEYKITYDRKTLAKFEYRNVNDALVSLMETSDEFKKLLAREAKKAAKK